MRTCAACGFHNTDDSSRCFRCKAVLAHDAEERGDSKPRHSRPPRRLPGFGGLPGQVALGRARIAVAGFLEGLFAPPPPDFPSRRPFASGFLSLIPGLGQFHNGQPRKALLFLLVWIAVIVAIWRTFYMNISTWLVRGAMLWAVYAFHDGFKTALQINRQFWHTRLSVMVFCAWLFQIAIVSILSQYVLTRTALRFQHISADHLAPVVNRGERIMIDRMTHHFRDPEIGELVHYNPPLLIFGVSSGRHEYIDAYNAIERIVGGPGDTFESRGGRFFRNGEPVPDELGPLFRGPVTWDYKLLAPPGHYIIIVTQVHGGTDFLAGAVNPPMSEVLPDSWMNACVIPEDEIQGRVIAVYAPPSTRRWLRPPPFVEVPPEDERKVGARRRGLPTFE